MRKLNKEEVEILKKLKARNKIAKGLVSPPEVLKVDYVQQGNMTLAVIENKRKPLMGWSKYNANDEKLGLKFNQEIGQKRAFIRALTNNA